MLNEEEISETYKVDSYYEFEFSLWSIGLVRLNDDINDLESDYDKVAYFYFYCSTHAAISGMLRISSAFGRYAASCVL